LRVRTDSPKRRVRVAQRAGNRRAAPVTSSGLPDDGPGRVRATGAARKRTP
jgi:hypothetical protein